MALRRKLCRITLNTCLKISLLKFYLLLEPEIQAKIVLVKKEIGKFSEHVSFDCFAQNLLSSYSVCIAPSYNRRFKNLLVFGKLNVHFHEECFILADRTQLAGIANS